MSRRKYSVKKNEVVQHKNGWYFICIEPGKNPTLMNVKTGWEMVVHGLGQYDDGKIDWDFSTGGCWSYMGEDPEYIAAVKKIDETCDTKGVAAGVINCEYLMSGEVKRVLTREERSVLFEYHKVRAHDNLEEFYGIAI